MLIDGDVTDSPASCVGENVTFVCTVASLGHAWTVDSYFFGEAVLANFGDEEFENGIFTFRRVNVSDILTSSVSVISYSGLNGILIVCVDGGGGAEEQRIVAQVYGEFTGLHFSRGGAVRVLC